MIDLTFFPAHTVGIQPQLYHHGINRWPLINPAVKDTLKRPWTASTISGSRFMEPYGVWINSILGICFAMVYLIVLSLKKELEPKTRADAGKEKMALAKEYEISRQTLYRVLARLKA